MPELPEVETIVRGLETPLRGRRVTAARLARAGLYRPGSLGVGELVGREITSVERVGKNAVFRFGSTVLMTVNLGMTGRLTVSAAEDVDNPRRRGSHLHGRFRLDDGAELRYHDPRRFGYVYVARGCDFFRDLNIGPDPFGARPAALARALEGRSAAVKSILLNQRIVSGIGNIYADEILFDAGIDPRTAGEDAARHAGRILASARRVLKRAIAAGGSTIRDYRRSDGTPGEFQRRHAVYGRKGEPCVACGATIKKTVLCGRGTHFCPVCQALGGF
jgi:formamidopyrimidine-DNA glycosylase